MNNNRKLKCLHFILFVNNIIYVLLFYIQRLDAFYKDFIEHLLIHWNRFLDCYAMNDVHCYHKFDFKSSIGKLVIYSALSRIIFKSILRTRLKINRAFDNMIMIIGIIPNIFASPILIFIASIRNLLDANLKYHM